MFIKRGGTAWLKNGGVPIVLPESVNIITIKGMVGHYSVKTVVSCENKT